MEQRQVQSEVLLQVVAGSDTTATAIRMTLFLLATTPRAYRRLQREIDDGIASGRISAPITNAEGKALPYLQAVIREGLRYHPPGFNLLPKVVPPSGDTLCGQFVPGGTQIGVNSWSMARRPDIFGADPDVFRPERWLEASPERRAEMDRVGDLVFGHGRFMCAGKVLALMELNKTFVEVGNASRSQSEPGTTPANRGRMVPNKTSCCVTLISRLSTLSSHFQNSISPSFTLGKYTCVSRNGRRSEPLSWSYKRKGVVRSGKAFGALARNMSINR